LKSEASHKILGGVNLYGNDFSDGGGGGAIVGDAYLKLLKAKKPKFKWDEVFAEHRFDYQQGGVSHQVWFPTLAYLQQRFEIAQSSLGTGLSFWELGQGLDYFYDLL
jgi:chitinase domain-containing protein 1